MKLEGAAGPIERNACIRRQNENHPAVAAVFAASDHQARVGHSTVGHSNVNRRNIEHSTGREAGRQVGGEPGDKRPGTDSPAAAGRPAGSLRRHQSKLASSASMSD
jgi:hypothetical protein